MSSACQHLLDDTIDRPVRFLDLPQDYQLILKMTDERVPVFKPVAHEGRKDDFKPHATTADAAL